MSYYVYSYSGVIGIVSLRDKYLELAKYQNPYPVFTQFSAEYDSF